MTGSEGRGEARYDVTIRGHTRLKLRRPLVDPSKAESKDGCGVGVKGTKGMYMFWRSNKEQSDMV
jgi:hypothetical protein